MRIFLFFIILSIISSHHLFGQVATATLPLSYTYKLAPLEKYEQMDGFDTETYKAQDLKATANNLKKKRFAKGFYVDFHPLNCGTWEITSGGHKVWRLGIQSKNAYSLYLVFGKFKLNPGVTIFVYNPDYSKLSEAISYKQNNINNLLPVAPITGDKIIIEVDLEPGIENFGELLINNVWHDYQNLFGSKRTKSVSAFSTGDCNVDINCEPGNNWQIEKQAVCKIITDGELCTGTLINNILEDKTPYLITAYHCIDSIRIAAASIFYFNYENPYCGATGYYNEHYTEQSIAGALLVATTPHELDFSLVRLNRFPPISFRAYLAGWDASVTNQSSTIAGGGVCIHHPWGDTKKIAIDLSKISTGNFGEKFNDYSQWQIGKWDIGVTEPGSSGSALFNTNFRVIGTLTGGEATCENPVNDYFTKLALAFDYYDESNKQLKYWLDPENSGKRLVDGLEPYGFTDKNCDTIQNYPSGSSLELSKDTMRYGFITGHNSQHMTDFAEKFYTSDTIEIPAVTFNVAKSVPADYLSNIQLKIWKGNNYPTELIYSQTVFLNSLMQDTSNIIHLDSLVQVKGTFFIGYSVNYISSVDSLPTDTFALFHANTGNEGFYINKNNNWLNINNTSSNHNYASLSVGYVGCKNLNTTFRKYPEILLPSHSGKFFPNPCNQYFTLGINEIATDIVVECFDITGKKSTLPFDTFYFHSKFYVTNLARGVYYVRITINGKKYSGKIFVNH